MGSGKNKKKQQKKKNQQRQQQENKDKRKENTKPRLSELVFEQQNPRKKKQRRQQDDDDVRSQREMEESSDMELDPVTQITEEDLQQGYLAHLRSLPLDDIKKLTANIPMRLTEKERGYLEIIESALEVSEYTNNVDVAKSDIMYYDYYFKQSDVGLKGNNKQRVIEHEHEDLKRIMLGLLVSFNFREGMAILRSEEKKERFLQDCFEVGRRYKASNPSMMRDTYQKMMHVLQDAANYNPQFIGPVFTRTREWKPIYTVEIAMNECGMKLEDILCLIGLKDHGGMTEKDVEENYGEFGMRIVYSIKDGIEASSKSCGVVFGMLQQLEHYREETKSTSLAIQYGKGGSKLTHSHSDHFLFVYQSLNLWWNVMRYMPLLWIMNDRDFLSGRKYSLVNTGQGLQRMQQCPNVSSAIHTILHHTQKVICKGREWKGLSVIHLYDRDVPNCLFFIDKYSQVPWILAPVLKTSTRLIEGREDERIPMYFELHSSKQWGKAILKHFFQQGFNGSGSDGGSCIDGRLTSAWNWCSMIEKYIYHPLFLLTDFEGFEGPYKK